MLCSKSRLSYFSTESLDFSEEIYLVEGVFKAAKLHNLGLTALALLGSDSKRHYRQLKMLNRPLAAIGDNNGAGRKFARPYGGFVSPRDLDEMSDIEVLELLKKPASVC